MKPRIRIVTPTYDHVVELAVLMRDADRVEIARLGYPDATACLHEQIQWSCYAQCLVVDGETLAMWGLVKHDLLSDDGLPWAFTARGVERHKRLFLACSKMALNELTRYARRLRVAVDTTYARSCRWMVWMGFELAGFHIVDGHTFSEYRYRGA